MEKEEERLAGRLFHISKYHLENRSYEACIDYARRVSQIKPNFCGVSEIIAIAEPFLAYKKLPTEVQHDREAILKPDRLSQNSNLTIKTIVEWIKLLEQCEIPLPLAEEALHLLRRLLSEFDGKRKYDEPLESPVPSKKHKVNASDGTDGSVQIFHGDLDETNRETNVSKAVDPGAGSMKMEAQMATQVVRREKFVAKRKKPVTKEEHEEPDLNMQSPDDDGVVERGHSDPMDFGEV